jgi:hypothetical protein
VASSDLGGLGSRDGSPVIYNWTVPSLMPLLLPWLAILLLLILKPNRCAQAWWIWLPLGCLVLLGSVMQSSSNFLPSSILDLFLEVVIALAFGLAAVWLLSTYMGRKHRFLTFLGLLLALAGFSVLSFVVRQGSDLLERETLQSGILLAACVLVISVAVSLAGLLCRRRYRPVRFSLWLVAFLVVVWSVIVTPFFVVALVANGGGIPVMALVASVLTMTGITFVLLLPFLILSFTSSFFRERLKGLLHMEVGIPPKLSPSLPAVGNVT